MNWFESLIAGIIQGLTEFLPISSSGHLVIYGELVGEDGAAAGSLAFTVLLHFATLLAVIIMYRKDVWALIRELIWVVADLFRGKAALTTPGRKVYWEAPGRRYLLMVVIGTIPAVIAGLGIKALDFDSLLENIFVVAVMLLVTAAFMFLIDRLPDGKLTAKDAPLKTAWIVGILQGIAILPGLSRSGSTIFGGVLGGLKKEFAVRYAFILSIPAILGATILEVRDVLRYGAGDINIAGTVLGFAAAFVCGLLAIKLIRVLVNRKKFYVFGIYCICASVFAFMVGFGVF